MTHTPGPAESQAIEIFRVLAKKVGPEKALNVLAAAPDLLEALEAVLSECQVAAPLNLGRWHDEYYEAFNMARVTLAKSRGQQ